jgi:hypothetical protein
MKIRIAYTINIDEDAARRTLDNYYGRRHRTRREVAEAVRGFMETHAGSDWQTAASDALGADDDE